MAWPTDNAFRRLISESTLYVTLEPNGRRAGEEKPPMAQLVQMSGVPRLVIGCPDPVEEDSARSAAALHASGVSVTMGVSGAECRRLVSGYAALVNSPMQAEARRHRLRHGRPLGHLHCSVIDSDDAGAFVRNGNSFGKNFGGQHLSYRDFGTYEIAPPPESIWARSEGEDGGDELLEHEVDDFFIEGAFDGGEDDEDSTLMMPWYESVDAVVATFPAPGRGECSFLFRILTKKGSES